MRRNLLVAAVSPIGIRPAVRILPSVLTFFLLVAVVVPSQAIRKKVGPDGDHLTIQGAVNDCASGADYEIDAQGPWTYTENVSIPASFVAGSITITGGWNSSFTVRDEHSSLTIIDGGGGDPVVDVQLGGGSFTLEGFAVTNGSAEEGAGINVSPAMHYDTAVTLTNLIVRNNSCVNEGPCLGVGIRAHLTGSEHLEISQCQIHDNSATATGPFGIVVGCGLEIFAEDDSTFLLESSWVENNTSTAVSHTNGAGHLILARDDSSGEILDLRVSGNTCSGTPAFYGMGSGGIIETSDYAQVVVRRSAWAMNTDNTGKVPSQLELVSQNLGLSILMTDSAVALGNQNGLAVSTSTWTEARLVNLTVVDNTLTGIEISAD